MVVEPCARAVLDAGTIVDSSCAGTLVCADGTDGQRGFETGPDPVDSVRPGDQPIVYTTGSAEFARANTFGELLELTLTLRPK